MQRLSHNEIVHIFDRLHLEVSSEEAVLVALKSLKPDHHQLDSAVWRYQLDGFMLGLHSTNKLSQRTKSRMHDALFNSEALLDVRPGKEIAYSVEICTENGKDYQFDVPATNPLDAYFQLTKRIAYKSIPDIKRIEVFTGFSSAREKNLQPVKTLHKDELIFVTLL